MLNKGEIAPDFTLQDQNGNMHTLSQYKGKKVVLYFYPRDDTPGCTKEACGFQDNLSRFDDVAVLGVSADDVASHKRFAEKYKLSFPLLADAEKEVVVSYDVFGEKSMMGKLFMGIKRVTYIIDEQGIIEHVYPKVKAKEHAQQILEYLGKGGKE